MNYLAHFHLGKISEACILGNFIGDFVKGSDYKQYPEEVQHGILMHRFIDDYTDKHSLVHDAKRLLGTSYGHYNGVIIDIFYDYFLASNWNAFSAISLNDFITNSYNVLNKYQEDMPFSAQYAYRHMVKNDWLNRYTNLVGLKKTFLGLNAYLKRETGMEKSIHDLIDQKEIFNQNFLAFYPQLLAETQKFEIK